MAKKDVITLDEVRNAVVALRNKGVNPTYSNIRRELGDRGSNSTLAKFLSEIDEEESVGADSIQAKDAFTAIWNQLRAVVLKEFSEKLSTQVARNAELLDELNVREVSAREALAKSSESEASARTLMEEMRKISVERDHLTTSMASIQAQLHASEKALAHECSQTERLKGVLATIRGYFGDRKDVSADMRNLFEDIQKEWSASPGTGIALRLSAINAEQQARIDALTSDIAGLLKEREARRDESASTVLISREEAMQSRALLAASEREIAFLKDQLSDLKEEKVLAVNQERISFNRLQERSETHAQQLAQAQAKQLDMSTQIDYLKGKYCELEIERDKLKLLVSPPTAPVG